MFRSLDIGVPGNEHAMNPVTAAIIVFMLSVLGLAAIDIADPKVQFQASFIEYVSVSLAVVSGISELIWERRKMIIARK